MEFAFLEGVCPRFYLPLLGSLARVTALAIDNHNLNMADDAIHLRGVFAAAPCLMHLELRCGIFYAAWPSAMTVDLPALHTLLIRARTSEPARQITSFLEALTAPSLETLTLKGLYDEGPPFDERLVLCQSQKFAALRKLTVYDSTNPLRGHMENVGSENLQRLALAFPSVVDFCYGRSQDDILSIFGEGGSATYWPRLQTLMVSMEIAVAGSHVRSFLDLRRSAGCPIQKLTLYGTKRQNPWAVAEKDILPDVVHIEEHFDYDFPDPFPAWKGCYSW